MNVRINIKLVFSKWHLKKKKAITSNFCNSLCVICPGGTLYYCFSIVFCGRADLTWELRKLMFWNVSR